MDRTEFIHLIGKDVVVEYPFFGELQLWSMKNFSYDEKTDTISHNRIPLLVDVFISNARNPHKGDAIHG